MKVLLLGGTSFFGKDMVRCFHEAGHSISVFTRGRAMPKDLPSIRHLKGDRNQPADLEKAAKEDEWDIVIDNIAYDGIQTQHALKAFARVKRYVLCSTVSVYRFAFRPEAQPLVENTVNYDAKPAEEDPTNIHWKYARGKLEAERAVVKQTAVPWTILRPPVVYGPYDISDRGFWYLSRVQEGGPILLAHGGVQSFRLIYSVDTARSFLSAVESEKTVGKAYNVAQSEVITLRDFIEKGAEFLGKKAEFLNMPFEYLGQLAGPYANMTNLIQDCSAAQRDFGFTTTPWSEFACLTAHWFRDRWQGDRSALLKTREEELLLARQWAEAVGKFKKREWR